jgi:hypothetical protein
MSETLVRFTEAIKGRDGRAFTASARGARGSDGMWHGWVEFTDETTILRTTQESEQPNRDDLMYWAQGLTYVYLEGALERALHPLGEHVLGSPALSIEQSVRPVAVLDPYSVYRQGDDVLRRQLLALSREQLNAVIVQYDLGAPIPYGPRGPLGYADAVDRVMARIRTSSASNTSTPSADREIR